jgi:hypothetical protein
MYIDFKNIHNLILIVLIVCAYLIEVILKNLSLRQFLAKLEEETNMINLKMRQRIDMIAKDDPNGSTMPVADYNRYIEISEEFYWDPDPVKSKLPFSYHYIPIGLSSELCVFLCGELVCTKRIGVDCSSTTVNRTYNDEFPSKFSEKICMCDVCGVGYDCAPIIVLEPIMSMSKMLKISGKNHWFPALRPRVIQCACQITTNHLNSLQKTTTFDKPSQLL